MRLFRVIKEYLNLIVNNIVLLTGTGLFIYGLFNFSSSYYRGYKTGNAPGKIELDFTEKIYPIATHYYYETESIQIITIGAILIVLGLLIREKRNEEKL